MKQFAALNTTIVNCFGEHKLNATSTITTPETCPSLTKVFKCIYDAAKTNKAVLKGSFVNALMCCAFY